MQVTGIIAQHWVSQMEFMEEPGIYLPDDTFIPLDVQYAGDSCRVVPGKLGPLPALPADDDWDFGAILCQASDGVYLAQAGEPASHGSAGFVVLSAKSVHGDYELKWIAVFDNSDNFEHIWLRNGAVEAWSTAQFIWSFRLETPWDIVVTPAPFDQYK